MAKVTGTRATQSSITGHWNWFPDFVAEVACRDKRGRRSELRAYVGGRKIREEHISRRVWVQREEAWDGWISKKCNVAGDTHSIPAWKVYATSTDVLNGRCANVTSGAVGWRLFLPPFSRAGFPRTRKYTHAAASGGSMNLFCYCGAEHNLEQTGVQTASNHACKRDR
jgi:hypothetical protein